MSNIGQTGPISPITVDFYWGFDYIIEVAGVVKFGRHAWFRAMYRKVWRFKSSPRHQSIFLDLPVPQS